MLCWYLNRSYSCIFYKSVSSSTTASSCNDYFYSCQFFCCIPIFQIVQSSFPILLIPRYTNLKNHGVSYKNQIFCMAYHISGRNGQSKDLHILYHCQIQSYSNLHHQSHMVYLDLRVNYYFEHLLRPRN